MTKYRNLVYLATLLGAGAMMGAVPQAGSAQTTAASTPYSGTAIALPGTFMAANFDKGGQSVAYYDTTPGNQGGQYRLTEDVDIVTSCDTSLTSPYTVNNFATSEWLKYTVNVTTSGSYQVQLRAANNYTSSLLPAYHLEVDGASVTGSVTVPKTGSWCSFQWVAAPTITLSAGTHVIKVVSDRQYFNLETISVTTAATGTGSSYMSSYKGKPYTGTPIAVPGSFMAANFDLGGQNVGYYDTTAGNQGGQYRTSEDVDIVTSCDTAPTANYAINNFVTGEWLNYTINVTTAGNYVVQLRASSNYANATAAFHLEVDGVKAGSSTTVPGTTSWCLFQWVSAPAIYLSAGTHVLKIFADQQYFNLESVSILSSGSTTSTSTTTTSTATTTTTTQGTTTIPGAGVSWSCDYEQTYCNFNLQNAAGDSFGTRDFYTTTARSGKYAIDLHTNPGDSNVHGSGSWERSDISLPNDGSYGHEGQEEWWADSMYFPSPGFTYPTTGLGCMVVLDFHSSATGDTQPNFQIYMCGNIAGFYLRGAGGTADPTTEPGRWDVIVPDPYGSSRVSTNKWYDWVFHVKWSSTSAGLFEVYLNGKKVASHSGPTIFAGYFAYLKLANYHDAYGVSEDVIHDRTIRGTSSSAVAIGTLSP